MTKTKKLTMGTIEAGDEVRYEYGDRRFPSRGKAVFLGFAAGRDEAHINGPKIANLKEVKKLIGARTLADIYNNGSEGLYAIFCDIEDGMVWAAYLSDCGGRVSYQVGTSADPIRLVERV